MTQCLIRKATNNDLEELRELYLALEEDGVRCLNLIHRKR